MAKKKTTKKTSKKATSKGKKTKDENVLQVLEFKLDGKDLEEFADKAAKLTVERNELVEKKKTETKVYSDKIKESQKEIDRLLKCHEQKFEEKEVSCIKRSNYTDGTVSYLVDKKTIETRDMTESECQMTMDTTQKTKKKAKKTKLENNPDTHQTPEEIEARNTRDVIREETNKNTKRSAVNGKNKADLSLAH